MTSEEILGIFRTTGALLSGHFILTSGDHSPSYFQCARVLQYPEYAKRLCGLIAGHFRDESVGVVVAPAVGGIIVAHEVASALGCRCMFTERENGAMTFRRGFELKPGEKALVVEDVVTTGGSLNEVIELCVRSGAEVAGAACLVDRSEGRAVFARPVYSLLSMSVEKFQSHVCPLCKAGVMPAVKPGSRGLKT